MAVPASHIKGRGTFNTTFQDIIHNMHITIPHVLHFMNKEGSLFSHHPLRFMLLKESKDCFILIFKISKNNQVNKL